MSEDTPTCRIHEKYKWIKCTNLSLPGDPDGFCILHSHIKEKDPATFKAAVRARCEKAEGEFYDFRGVFFPGPFDPANLFGSRSFAKAVYFSESTFTEGADFCEAIFKEEVNFLGATFEEWADFSMATFTKEAFFPKATFMKVADFSRETIFMEEANFQQSTFLDYANFYEAIFKKKADFSWATFKEKAEFLRTSFEEEALFTGVTIQGRVVFQSLNPQAWKFKGVFEELQFSTGGVLRFQDLSLAQVSFAGTDLRQLEFRHVDWNFYSHCQAVYDEVLLRQHEKKEPWFWTWFLENAPYVDPPQEWTDRYGEVERLYRDLQVNYESVNDSKSSSDFHYGEMEMHRRASKWRWFPFYWYNLYWALSGYGERPLRSVLTLIGLLLALSGLFLGLENEILGGWSLTGFWQAFLYVFQQGTLQKPEWLKPATTGGKFLSALIPIFIPGQAALFLLALRNRLGRRR
jgi:uncharacterized protein YjbI with pentapeptide repeats